MAGLTAPKAVIFDWDNTLVDTWPLIHGALHETFVKYGLTPWTIEETKDRVAHSMRDAFPVLFGSQWEQAAQDYQQFYLRDHLTALKILPHAEEVLQFLHQHGVYLAVVSNKKGTSLRKEAAHIGWDKYFAKLVGASDAAQDKPNPAPVLLALENSGLQAGADVWFVGDTTVDLECAGNTLCTPVLYGDVVVDGVMPTLQYRGFNVACHARNHADFLALLKPLFDE